MSRTVDPTEIRDTTDRLAHLLGPSIWGPVCRRRSPSWSPWGSGSNGSGTGSRPGPPPASRRPRCGRATATAPPTDWLARQTGTSKADAGRLVETGRQLEALPAVAGAVTRGELSARQAEADRRRGRRGSGGPAPAARQGQGRVVAGAAGRVPPHPRQRRVRPRGRPPAGPRQAVLPDLDRRRRRHRAPAALGARGGGGEGRQRHPPPRRQASSVRPGPRAGANRRRPTPTTPPPSC